jgi:hypothetical protein
MSIEFSLLTKVKYKWKRIDLEDEAIICWCLENKRKYPVYELELDDEDGFWNVSICNAETGDFVSENLHNVIIAPAPGTSLKKAKKLAEAFFKKFMKTRTSEFLVRR